MRSPAPTELPTGTVTFLFTDIEGSTRLLQSLGDRYRSVVSDHAALLRQALASHGGTEVSTEGDAFFAVFRSPIDAVLAVVDAQRALGAHHWPGDSPVRVRMGLHTGEGVLGGDDYAGIDVNRAARIAAAGHGGQILLSDATRALIIRALPDGVEVRDLGVHRLKDLDTPEHLFQLEIAGLPTHFPPVRAVRAGNLPTPATSFVGREREVEMALALLEASRLLTLVGPGGTGKTRLALRVATDAADRYADGAYFVPLETIAEPELVPSAIGRVLGVAASGDQDPLAALQDHLAAREILLVLDNFEQVLSAARNVDLLLAAAPRLRVIVTSRAPLGLYGEQQFPVPPLGLPDPAHLPAAAQLSQYEAVALFIARARAVRPDFAVTSDNAPAVAEICTRLDGLPLAIELAAARIKVLTPDAILKRLASSLGLLASTAVNLTERQRTLHGAIAWSYDLLTDPEQRLLERFAVFSGGWALEAAEAICDPDAELGVDILDGLASLVDKSLVRQREEDGEPRFGLLETIREFGLARLRERGESHEIGARHAEHVLALAVAAEPHLNWTADARWYRRLTVEYDNVRAALRFAIDAGREDLALGLVGAIWRFWQREGLLTEGRWWTDEALAMPGSEVRTALRAKALLALGSLAYWQGDLESMRLAYEEALEIYREVDDPAGVAWATFNVGFIHATPGDTATGLEYFRDANDRFRTLNDSYGITESLFVIAYTKLLGGDPDAAQPGLEEALSLTGENWVRRGDALIGLGQVHRLRGDPVQARRSFLEALRLAQHAHDMGTAVGAVELLGAIEVAEGPAAIGARLFGAAAALRETSGGGPPMTLMMIAEPLEEARRVLGADAFEAEMARGRQLDLDAVRTLAEAVDRGETPRDDSASP